jgi:hypothetical protein
MTDAKQLIAETRVKMQVKPRHATRAVTNASTTASSTCFMLFAPPEG